MADELLLTPEEIIAQACKLVRAGWSQDQIIKQCVPKIEAQLAKALKLDITCPFCNDSGDYDLIGLKYHLSNHCEVYRNTEVVGL